MLKDNEKKDTGITVKKENFSEWYTQVVEKSEIADARYNIKGFIVIRPWGAVAIENMYKIYEKALQERGHKPCFFPVVIPERNFKKESSHVEGFTPQVFWLEHVQGEDKMALRPTSETAFYQMYSLWIRSWRDLPLKLYQRANVYRYETKATRPLIRAREFYWIEAHNAFKSKSEAETQVQEDIQTTEEVMHQQFGIPFLPMKRPEWDKFAGAVYTIGSDVLMPDGKIIQQPSTHFLGQHFSKAFDVKFKDEQEKEQYVWQTCYGPAISRILASIISTHGDDSGLVMPFCISPIQVIIIPIFNKENQKKVLEETKKIFDKIKDLGLTVEIDCSEKRSGEKFYNWELKGVPLRIEIGEKEIKSKKIIVFLRDIKKKEIIDIKKIDILKKLGKEFDIRLKEKADKFMNDKIVDCKTKDQIEKTINSKKIARVNFCSTNKEGIKCAEVIEKDTGAEIRGTLANTKEETFGNKKCIICNNDAEEVVYIGKSY
ncbi:MAG TPA: proline--tRNA ligase [Candidatus Paceibacterota bacterium]|nr:proline--tRNA ligase [Candidatus Paceibacterota bacterium]